MITTPILNFSTELSTLIESHATKKTYLKKDIILSKNVHCNQTAFLISGLLKVHLEENNSSLLLYHISQKTNPIITLMNINNQLTMTTSITAIEESILLWVPDSEIVKWGNQFLSLKQAIISSYEYNINQMISNLKKLTFNSLEDRLYDYLITKASLYNQQDIFISRTEISLDLNASRATISKAIKQLENKQKITTKPKFLTLLT